MATNAGRIIWPLAIGAGLSVFGFIPLMGIPGAVVAELAAMTFGFSERLRALGPGVWGLAIFVTWLAGPGVPVGCWTLWALHRTARLPLWIAAGAAGYLLFGVVTTMVVIGPAP